MMMVNCKAIQVSGQYLLWSSFLLFIALVMQMAFLIKSINHNVINCGLLLSRRGWAGTSWLVVAQECHLYCIAGGHLFGWWIWNLDEAWPFTWKKEKPQQQWKLFFGCRRRKKIGIFPVSQSAKPSCPSQFLNCESLQCSIMFRAIYEEESSQSGCCHFELENFLCLRWSARIRWKFSFDFSLKLMAAHYLCGRRPSFFNILLIIVSCRWYDFLQAFPDLHISWCGRSFWGAPLCFLPAAGEEEDVFEKAWFFAFTQDTSHHKSFELVSCKKVMVMMCRPK